MPAPTITVPLTLDRPDDVGRVRAVLDRAGFDDRHVRERMATDETVDLSFGPFDRARVLRRTRDGDPLATLIRLFLRRRAGPARRPPPRRCPDGPGRLGRPRPG